MPRGTIAVLPIERKGKHEKSPKKWGFPLLEEDAEQELRRGQTLVEERDGLDSAKIVFERDVLIGRVSILVGQSEAHEDARDLECVVHLRNEWNRATLADERRLLAEARFERLNRFLEDGMRIRRHPRFAGTEHVELARYGFRQQLSNVTLDEFRDFRGVLIRHEPRGKFRIRLGRNYGLGSFALVAAPNAVQLESGANPEPLDDGVALLAAEGPRANRLPKILFFPGKRVQGPELLGRKRRDAIVKSRNGDAEILVVELGDHFGQNRDRIRDGAAENSRVQVLHGSGDFDLIIVQTPKAVRNRRNAFRQHRGIRNDERIRLEAFAVLANEIPQTHAADFLFPFDHHLDVDGQFSSGVTQRFQRLDVDVNLSFVVRRAAAIEISVADGGVERRSGPKIQRFRGLNVIVSVEKDRRLAWSAQRFAIDERMHPGGRDFYVFQASGAKLIRHPARRFLDVRLVFRLRANAGNAQKFL